MPVSSTLQTSNEQVSFDQKDSNNNENNTSCNDSDENLLIQKSSQEIESSASASVSFLTKGWIIGLASVPAILDGIGYGSLSFSQLLNTLFSLDVLKADPHHLKQPRYFMPLLILPTSAAAGVIALAIYENKHFIEERIQSSIRRKSVKEKIYATGSMLHKHPVEGLCLTIGAIVEGIIVYTNIGFIVNQFGSHFKDSILYYLGMGLAAGVAAQSIMLHGPHFIELIREGTIIPKFSDKKKNWKVTRALLNFIVHTFPVISALTEGALAAAESYELTQYIVDQSEREDIANRIAWLPAFMLGIIYAALHYAVYGRQFKQFLAYSIRQWNFSHDARYHNTPFQLEQPLWKRLALYLSVFLTSCAAAFIGFGALSDLSYIIAYNEPPAVPGSSSDDIHPPVLSLTALLLAFSMPAIILGLERYAVEGRSTLKLADIIDGQAEKDQLEILKSAKQIVQPSGKNYYSANQLFSDIGWAMLIGGSKFIIDFIYMPSSVPADKVTIKNTLSVAAIIGMMAAGYYGLTKLYHYVKREEQKNRRLQQLMQFNAGNTLVQQEAINLPLTRKQLMTNIALVWIITTLLTAGMELIIRYGVLGDQNNEEDAAMTALNNAQVLAAITAGFSAVFAERGAKWIKNSIVRAGENCFSFFSRSKENSPQFGYNSPSSKGGSFKEKPEDMQDRESFAENTHLLQPNIKPLQYAL